MKRRARKRQSAELTSSDEQLLSLSRAVAILTKGMFGGFRQTKPVHKIKLEYQKAPVVFGPWKNLHNMKALRRDLIDPLIAAHSGRTFKLMGDGALVEFASAVDAVTCAIEMPKQILANAMRAARKTAGSSSGSASMLVTSSSTATTSMATV